jgi:hypothetical protein
MIATVPYPHNSEVTKQNATYKLKLVKKKIALTLVLTLTKRFLNLSNDIHRYRRKCAHYIAASSVGSVFHWSGYMYMYVEFHNLFLGIIFYL